MPLLLAFLLINSEGLSSNAQQADSESPDPSKQTSQPSTPTAVESSESLMPNLSQSIDTFTAIALGLAILSLVANGLLLWILQNLKQQIKFLRESNSTPKTVETQKQPSISQMQIIKLQNELNDHTRQIGDLENRLKALSSQRTGAEFATVRESFPVQIAPPLEDHNSYVQSDWRKSPDNFVAQSIQQPVNFSPYAVLLNEYHTNPKNLEKRATKVSESEDSIYRRRQDSGIKNVTLQNGDNYSNYWVLSVDSLYWLLPKQSLRLDNYSISTFEALFEFQGNPKAQLHIIKPAQVRQGAMNGEWELVDRGEIEFV